MPRSVQNIRNQTVTLFTAAERDLYIRQWGRSPQSFSQSPDWAAPMLPEFPLYHYILNPMEGDWWGSNFSAPETLVPKPGFYEIFTNGRGPLTGPEVRSEIERTGVKVDQHIAVSEYLNKLDADHALYTEDLDMDELREQLSPRDFGRLNEVVHPWVSAMLDAEPVYFGFKTDRPIDTALVMIEGVPHVTAQDVSKVPSIGIAFPGRHALVRDLFNPGVGVWNNSGRDAQQRPGRDRWARFEGINTFGAYLFSPVLALTAIQKLQLLEGRDVTFELSPVLPPSLLRWEV